MAEEQLVLFRLGNEEYAISITYGESAKRGTD
jgi:hypothetical protein